jgi:hypothetical protein
MKERANAILVFLIGLLLIVYWMWPAADQPIGHLHERRIIRIQLQDVRKRSFEVSDSAFIQRFVRHLDASKPVLGLTGRDSRGFFQCWLTAANRKDPIVIDMLCKGKYGNWINQPGDFAGPSLDSAMAMLWERFPEGQWCPVAGR